MVNLEKIFEKQLELQTWMKFPCGWHEEGCKENLLHVIVEATEALNELNFKPWKPLHMHRPVDKEALATELTDIIQFVINAAIAMEFSADDLSEALTKKWEVNKERLKR